LHTTSGSAAGVFDRNERSEWPTWKLALPHPTLRLRLFFEIFHLLRLILLVAAMPPSAFNIKTIKKKLTPFQIPNNTLSTLFPNQKGCCLFF